MRTFILPLARKGLSVLALSIAGFWHCSAQAASTDPSETIRPAASLEGNFLAAYIAGAARDTAAATVFFREAIQEDPRNQELLERGFVAFLGNGSMNEAYRAAERLALRDPSNNLAQFALGVRDIKERRYGDARAKITGGKRNPPDGSHRDASDRLVLCGIEGRQARAGNRRPAERASGPSTSSANITPR